MKTTFRIVEYLWEIGSAPLPSRLLTFILSQGPDDKKIAQTESPQSFLSRHACFFHPPFLSVGPALPATAVSFCHLYLPYRPPVPATLRPPTFYLLIDGSRVNPRQSARVPVELLEKISSIRSRPSVPYTARWAYPEITLTRELPVPGKLPDYRGNAMHRPLSVPPCFFHPPSCSSFSLTSSC